MKTKIPDELYRPCPHYPYGKVSGFMCESCIDRWASGAEITEIESLVQHFSEIGQSIAAERLQNALKKKKVFKP